jgi:hypothetical protein
MFDIHRDVSGFNGQLASLMIISQAFLTYGSTSEDVPVSVQCVSLENALVSLGHCRTLSSVLNLAWLIAGGPGLPVPSGRETRINIRDAIRAGAAKEIWR